MPTNEPPTAEGDSLATSAWVRVVSQYLTASIRVGAYAANVHLLSLLDSSIDGFISHPVVRKLAYVGYGVIVYEIAARIVRIRYRPKFFVRASDGKKFHPNRLARLVLNDKDYEYRVSAEKLIYESMLYYGFSLVVAVALCKIITVEAGWWKVGLGVLGAFVSFFNYYGVVVIASLGMEPFSPRHIPFYALGFGFMAPLVVYVVCTLV